MPSYDTKVLRPIRRYVTQASCTSASCTAHMQGGPEEWKKKEGEGCVPGHWATRTRPSMLELVEAQPRESAIALFAGFGRVVEPFESVLGSSCFQPGYSATASYSSGWLICQPTATYMSSSWPVASSSHADQDEFVTGISRERRMGTPLPWLVHHLTADISGSRSDPNLAFSRRTTVGPPGLDEGAALDSSRPHLLVLGSAVTLLWAVIGRGPSTYYVRVVRPGDSGRSGNKA